MARPRPGPPLLARPPGVDAVEALEEARQVLGADRPAVVGDREHHADAVPAAARRALRRRALAVLERVVDEVLDHLLEPHRRLPADALRPRRRPRRAAPLRAAPPRSVSATFDAGSRDFDRLADDVLGRLRLELAQREQVLNERADALRLAVDDLEELALRCGVRVPLRSVSAYPWIAVTGVRSSWETLATKSRRRVRRRRIRVMSRRTVTEPEAPPFEPEARGRT